MNNLNVVLLKWSLISTSSSFVSFLTAIVFNFSVNRHSSKNPKNTGMFFTNGSAVLRAIPFTDFNLAIFCSGV